MIFTCSDIGDKGPKPSQTPYPISIGGPYPTTVTVDVPTIATPYIPSITIPSISIPSITIPDIPTPTIAWGGHNKRSVEVEAKREGAIKVTSADGSVDGYISAPNEEGLYGFTLDASSAVRFSFSPADAAPFVITGEATESEVRPLADGGHIS